MPAVHLHDPFIGADKSTRTWLSMAGIVNGPLFRAINRHDQAVGDKALTRQSVALIVKSSVRMMAGADAAKNVAGHSLLAGYCTGVDTVGLLPYQRADRPQVGRNARSLHWSDCQAKDSQLAVTALWGMHADQPTIPMQTVI